MKRAFLTCTVVLSLIGVGVSIEHLIDAEHYNAGFHEHPWILRLHVVPGALYLLLALPQFVTSLRTRRPRLHRAAGWVAVVSGVLAGITALVITILFPFSGPLALLVVGPFAVWFLFSLAQGLRRARARRIAEHREWMIRALAIGTSIATMRLIFVPAFVGLGEMTDARARWLSLTSFGLAFAIHAAVAEGWIRATRPGHAPARSRLEQPARLNPSSG